MKRVRSTDVLDHPQQPSTSSESTDQPSHQYPEEARVFRHQKSPTKNHGPQKAVLLTTATDSNKIYQKNNNDKDSVSGIRTTPTEFAILQKKHEKVRKRSMVEGGQLFSPKSPENSRSQNPQTQQRQQITSNQCIINDEKDQDQMVLSKVNNFNNKKHKNSPSKSSHGSVVRKKHADPKNSSFSSPSSPPSLSNVQWILPGKRSSKKRGQQWWNPLNFIPQNHPLRPSSISSRFTPLTTATVFLLIVALTLLIVALFANTTTKSYNSSNSNNNENDLLGLSSAESRLQSESSTRRHFKTAYSDLQPSDGQIWLLNANDFLRSKRHIAHHQEQHLKRKNYNIDRLPIFGLAKDCGQACSIRFQVGPKSDKQIVIQLKRASTESNLLYNQNPLVQFIKNEYENDTFIRPSRISPDCFYHSSINGSRDDTSTSTVLNLCDSNGGIFGTLSFDSGTFFIEPLVEAEEKSKVDLENSRRTKRFALFSSSSSSVSSDEEFRAVPTTTLRPHLIYPIRRMNFHGSSEHDRESGNGNIGRTSNPMEKADKIFESEHFYGKSERRTKRAANSWDHWVEVLVVADYKMLLYHQQNLENYVLTLFNTVASIYRHQSLGAAVNIIVVRLIVLKHERAGPLVSNRAQETLQKFCQWQQLYNDPNEDSPNHYDVAVLLTRADICRATNKCDTLGLAELGTMCDQQKSCAIIEDNGLSAAFTIAHELGHIFNIPHDDESKCAEFMPLTKNNFHIMAPTLEYNTNPWSWSPCSRAMLAMFLDNQRSKTQCIFDQPVERRYLEKMFETPAPGEMYSVNQQCKFVFGPNAEICPYMPTCRRLWCSNSIGYQIGCRTQHMPWADATPCGEKRWCYRGNCVGMSPEQRSRIDGGWGEWKQWGPCSRTCGGGVQKALRDCDSPSPSNGGKYCVGQRERYRPCNIQECPWDTPGFREVQCAEFDGKDVGIHGVPHETKWVPKSGVSENERCKLYCRSSGSAAFYLLREKVIDGTPCDRNGDDICIDGTCHKAGCDHRLGSDLKRDICGICGGDGSSCQMVQGTFNERGSFGYNEVVRIPAGSANIDITQTSYNGQKDDDNYLAIRDANGDFLLNGHYQVSVFHQQISVLDTVLEYSGSDHPTERINGTGPLRSDIYVQLLSVGNLNPPNVRYKFMHTTISEQQQASPALLSKPPQNSFYWRHGDQWSECSRKCQGKQVLQLQCVDAVSSRPVREERCANVPRPTQQERMCNPNCFYKWLTVLSGDALGRKLEHKPVCVRSEGPRDESTLDEECLNAGLPRPTSTTYAMAPAPMHTHPQQQHSADNNKGGGVPNDRQWTYSEWTQCSETCGSNGMKRRSVHCVDMAGRKLDSRYCEGISHEPMQTECNRIPCPEWVYGPWGECSRSCDGGIRMRTAACQNAAGTEFPIQHCIEGRHDRERCNEHTCVFWRFSTWSRCSVSCGEGVEHREARCVDKEGRPHADEKCDLRERIVEKKCKPAECPQWELGSWSGCSATCGDGFKSRSVRCVESPGSERKLPDALCPSERPSSHMPCNLGSCPYWKLGEWTECSVSCGQGFRRRKVDCLLKDSQQVVDDSLCANSQKPLKQEPCSMPTCPQWSPQPWQPCSVSCGVGVQRRDVNCVKHSSGTITKRTIVLHDRECTKGAKPLAERVCERPPCPNLPPYQQQRQQQRVIWTAGPWSECSKSCGDDGVQQRVVHCRDALRDHPLPEAHCFQLPDVPPAKSRPCPPQNPCPVTTWIMGDWEPCKPSCSTTGTGTQKRSVQCKPVNAECDPQKKPEIMRVCAVPICPPSEKATSEKKQNPLIKNGRWEVGEWSECSERCGGGWKRRSVFCNNGVGSNSSTLTKVTCRESERPVTFEQCNTEACRLGDWQIGPWTHCSKSCGESEQTREVWCGSLVDPLQTLEDSECKASERPLNKRNCSRKPCPQEEQRILKDAPTPLENSHNNHNANSKGLSPMTNGEVGSPRWTTGDWENSCPLTCVEVKVTRRRLVRCVDAKGRHLSDSNCAFEQRPLTEHPCRQPRDCPRWHKGRWGPCSVSCGRGVVRREIECRRGGGNFTHPDSECLAMEPKPVTERHCDMERCPTYQWRVGTWSKCMDPCKPSNQNRHVFCMSDTGKRAASRMCAPFPEPNSTRKCPTTECPYEWVAGPWSTCSKTCGVGYHFRRIECKVRAKNNKSNVSTTAVEPSYDISGAAHASHSAEVGFAIASMGSEPTVMSRMCMSLEKPVVTKECMLNECSAEYHWNLGPWSQCSRTCGPGFRRRKIRCLNRDGDRMDPERCDQQNRPRRREPCFLRNCLPSDCAELRIQHAQGAQPPPDGNYTVLVAGFRVRVYCHRMNETVPKTYINVPEHTNFAEFYGKRLSLPYTCPYDGRRNDSCQCSNNGHVNKGLTRFQRIRVDLNNMKINPNDFTFAITEHGSPVPYGTAGDCYSMTECPQGRFSIDLRGTGLRIVDDLQWSDQGHRTSSRIERSEHNALIQGFCGGYCGECAPDRFKGLVIEVDRRQKPVIGYG